MSKYPFTILLFTATILSEVGCSSARTGMSPATKRVTTTVLQTGSNIGRRIEVSETETVPQEPTEEPKPAKRKSAQATEEIVTRGGFR